MECRGELLRKELVEMYDIKPIAYVKLLEGQEKKSCTKDLITDKYYCFSYRKKGLEKEEEKTVVWKSFFCGYRAAKHFLDLLDEKPIKLFNPLTSESTSSNSGSSTRKTKEAKKWDPLTKQLYNALNILIIFWDVAPYGAILDIKEKLNKYYYKEPFDSQIKAVNKILSKDASDRKLVDMIDILSSKNTMKSYGFDLISKRLEVLELDNYFE